MSVGTSSSTGYLRVIMTSTPACTTSSCYDTGWQAVSTANAWDHRLNDAWRALPGYSDSLPMPDHVTIWGSANFDGNPAVLLSGQSTNQESGTLGTYGTWLKLSTSPWAPWTLNMKSGDNRWTCGSCYDNFSPGSSGYVRVVLLRSEVNSELNFPSNFEGLVLGCIDADFCK